MQIWGRVEFLRPIVVSKLNSITQLQKIDTGQARRGLAWVFCSSKIVPCDLGQIFKIL
jgi:hypothetical protein